LNSKLIFYKTPVRGGGVVQVVENLPGKWQALNPNLSTARKKERKEGRREEGKEARKEGGMEGGRKEARKKDTSKKKKIHITREEIFVKCNPTVGNTTHQKPGQNKWSDILPTKDICTVIIL
jgi:hypothetical protein